MRATDSQAVSAACLSLVGTIDLPRRGSPGREKTYISFAPGIDVGLIQHDIHIIIPLSEEPYQILVAKMISESVDGVVVSISNLDSLNQILSSLIFKSFTLVAGLGRAGAVTTNKNPVR